MRLKNFGKTLGLIIRIEQTPKEEVAVIEKAIRGQARDNYMQAMRNFCDFLRDPAMVKRGEGLSSFGVDFLSKLLVPQYRRASREHTQIQAGLLPVKPVTSVVFFNRLRWNCIPESSQVPEPIPPYSEFLR